MKALVANTSVGARRTVLAISNLAVRNHCAVRSERSPLHDVRQHAACDASWRSMSASANSCFLTDEQSKAARRSADWWSQTGSNRRPPACKAGALPAELWPLKARGRRSCSRIASSAIACLHRPAEPKLRRSEGWWAWEDLNFRPHAYQARALTN